MAKDQNKQLAIDVIARISSLEKEMKRAQGITKGSYDQMARSSRTATKQMEADMVRTSTRINQALASTSTKIGAYGKAFAGSLIGGAVGGLAAGSLVATLRSTASGIAQIGDEAKRAGVSAKAFQEWRFVAEQNRIGIDQMTDGLKELNLRADEFVQTGKGSASEAFQRLGYSAEDLKKKLQDPSALMLEIIGRLGQMEKAAQIRIADELFGGSAGERFVELLDQGENGIRRTIQRAHELGVVMDDELIKRAAEIDKKFNEISNTVGVRLKSAIVSAADSLVDFINSFKGFEFERTTRLGERMASLGKERLDVERQIIDLQDKQRRGVVGAGDGILGSSMGESTVLEALAEYQRRLEAIAAEEQMIGKVIDSRRVASPDNKPWVPPTPPPGGFGSSGGGKSEVEKQAEATRRLIGDLEHELAVIGKSNVEKEIANTLRRAGVDAASKEGEKISQLIRSIDAETEAVERNKKAQEARQQAIEWGFNSVGDAILSIADGSMKAEDAVKRLAVQLAQAVAQAALLGNGPLAGLFGGSGGGDFFGSIQSIKFRS